MKMMFKVEKPGNEIINELESNTYKNEPSFFIGDVTLNLEDRNIKMRINGKETEFDKEDRVFYTEIESRESEDKYNTRLDMFSHYDNLLDNFNSLERKTDLSEDIIRDVNSEDSDILFITNYSPSNIENYEIILMLNKNRLSKMETLKSNLSEDEFNSKHSKAYNEIKSKIERIENKLNKLSNDKFLLIAKIIK